MDCWTHYLPDERPELNFKLPPSWKDLGKIGYALQGLNFNATTVCTADEGFEHLEVRRWSHEGLSCGPSDRSHFSLHESQSNRGVRFYWHVLFPLQEPNCFQFVKPHQLQRFSATTLCTEQQNGSTGSRSVFFMFSVMLCKILLKCCFTFYFIFQFMHQNV